MTTVKWINPATKLRDSSAASRVSGVFSLSFDKPDVMFAAFFHLALIVDALRLC